MSKKTERYRNPRRATRDQSREHTAHHEAGHTVAHLRLGLGTGDVHIVANDSLGILGASMSCDGWEDEQSAQAQLMSFYSGYAAEVRFDPTDLEVARSGARSDFDRARDILGKLYSAKDIKTREAEWIARASAFVAENWHAIEVFAKELLAHDRIDGQFADSLLDFADGAISAADCSKVRLMMVHARRRPS